MLVQPLIAPLICMVTGNKMLTVHFIHLINRESKKCIWKGKKFIICSFSLFEGRKRREVKRIAEDCEEVSDPKREGVLRLEPVQSRSKWFKVKVDY